MDSVRYFEFDFVWKALSRYQGTSHYLDVSSPRLLPVLFSYCRKDTYVHMVNPDKGDLAITRDLVSTLKLADRCNLCECLVDKICLDESSIDVITSISVLEHIIDDREAIVKMWELLKIGGKLLLTVPCAAIPFEEFMDYNEYGLLAPDDSGFVFSQRFYDKTLIEENIISVTGTPLNYSIFGEKTKDNFFKNRELKFYPTSYPYWKEPWIVAKEYGYFDSISKLPGIGVIAMEFQKNK
jgi:SAM-dependent methyltransferase